MRYDLIHVLQNIKDEGSIAFILNNLKKDGVEELFNYLYLCDEETENRWSNIYYNLYKNQKGESDGN